MSLQKIEESVVCVDTTKNQIEDNPLKSKEASDLHMALKLGLSLCLDALDAFMDSLILNINEYSHIPLLDKAKCVQWFLSNKLDSLSRFHLCILDQQIMKTIIILGILRFSMVPTMKHICCIHLPVININSTSHLHSSKYL